MTTTQITAQAVTVHATNGRRIGTGTVRQVTPSGLLVDYTDTRGTKRGQLCHPSLVRPVEIGEAVKAQNPGGNVCHGIYVGDGKYPGTVAIEWHGTSDRVYVGSYPVESMQVI